MSDRCPLGYLLQYVRCKVGFIFLWRCLGDGYVTLPNQHGSCFRLTSVCGRSSIVEKNNNKEACALNEDPGITRNQSMQSSLSARRYLGSLRTNQFNIRGYFDQTGRLCRLIEIFELYIFCFVGLENKMKIQTSGY